MKFTVFQIKERYWNFGYWCKNITAKTVDLYTWSAILKIILHQKSFCQNVNQI
jgi:hypothetical protein